MRYKTLTKKLESVGVSIALLGMLGIFAAIPIGSCHQKQPEIVKKYYNAVSTIRYFEDKREDLFSKRSRYGAGYEIKYVPRNLERQMNTTKPLLEEVAKGYSKIIENLQGEVREMRENDISQAYFSSVEKAGKNAWWTLIGSVITTLTGTLCLVPEVGKTKKMKLREIVKE
ncbi:hypothetical protein KAT36_01260 [Candidatus Pacearchaeota archaeon]|nr:hypothetical protein [Candidatus Pacearchaeota archaeon]